MKLIQYILIPALITLVVIYFRRFRSRLLDRLIVLFLGATGSVLVAMPEWATVLAQLVGVGRGADLVTYTSLVGLVFFCVLLYSQLVQLEAHLTALVRAEAIAHAHRGGPTRGEQPNHKAQPQTQSTGW